MKVHEIRAHLSRELPLAADFDAFCLDCFPHVFRDLSPSMERQARTTHLLAATPSKEVAKALYGWLAAAGRQTPLGSKARIAPRTRVLVTWAGVLCLAITFLQVGLPRRIAGPHPMEPLRAVPTVPSAQLNWVQSGTPGSVSTWGTVAGAEGPRTDKPHTRVSPTTGNTVEVSGKIDAHDQATVVIANQPIVIRHRHVTGKR